MTQAKEAIIGVRATLALATLGLLGTTAYVRMSATESPPLKLYYWPFFGRAGAIIRMLDFSNTKFEWVSVNKKEEFMALLSARARSYSPVNGTCNSCDTFAPPVVVDGEVVLSQSIAVAMYVGDKVGLGDSVPSVYKAVQYMNDINDFSGEATAAALSGAKTLKVFIEGGRMQAWLANIEHSIQGPFYFGDKASYVDFQLLHAMDISIDDAFLTSLMPTLEMYSRIAYWSFHCEHLLLSLQPA